MSAAGATFAAGHSAAALLLEMVRASAPPDLFAVPATPPRWCANGCRTLLSQSNHDEVCRRCQAKAAELAAAQIDRMEAPPGGTLCNRLDRTPRAPRAPRVGQSREDRRESERKRLAKHLAAGLCARCKQRRNPRSARLCDRHLGLMRKRYHSSWAYKGHPSAGRKRISP